MLQATREDIRTKREPFGGPDTGGGGGGGGAETQVQTDRPHPGKNTSVWVSFLASGSRQ